MPCQCRKSIWFGTDPAPACASCSICGTGPGSRQPSPHEFRDSELPREIREHLEADGSEASLMLLRKNERCVLCYQTRDTMARRAAK